MPATAKKKTPKKKAKGKSKAIVENKPELVDPRKICFLAGYTDPKSPTFGNALQSALAAGYSREYSESITTQMPEWLSDNLGNDRRIRLAEAHLDEVLDMPIVVQVMGAFGPLYEKRETFTTKTLKNGTKKKVKHVEKVPVMTINTTRVKEKSKTAEFVLESLKKAVYGKDRGPKIGFTFNVAATKARYDA